MMKAVQLPDSFVKGLIVNVQVSLNGKMGTKQLKVCMVKARSITFIEVDRENRQNIFRKVERKDIVEFKPTAICEIIVRDGILPVKWESSWDSIGQPSQMSLNAKITPAYSKRSNGWAHRLKSNAQYNYGGGAHFRT
jgi:hypothetical protein